MAVQLQTFLGVSMSLGSALFGMVVLSKSKQCVISRRYLVQASMFGIGEFGYLLISSPLPLLQYEYAPQALLNPLLPLP